MNRAINWQRLVLGGLLATVICFVTDGLLHNVLLSADWKALYDSLHATPPSEHDHSKIEMIFFVIFELGRGFIGLAFYVLLRDRLGPGPKTAAAAALLSWLAFSVTGPVQMLPLGLFSGVLWWKMSAVQRVTSLAAIVPGAAVYKE